MRWSHSLSQKSQTTEVLSPPLPAHGNSLYQRSVCLCVCVCVCVLWVHVVYTIAPDWLDNLLILLLRQQEEMEREEHEPSPPVVPLGVKRVPSDDLMFMLKTQTYSPTDDTFEMESTTKKPSGSEQLQYRRISIADTHL